MKVCVVQLVAGQWDRQEFASTDLIAAMEVRGYTFAGLTTSLRLRPELQAQPMFNELVGPMWDGDAIRYEDAAANDILST